MPSPSEVPGQNEEREEGWVPEAWVYFIWIVLGFQIYCKIGYSTNPPSRYKQLLTGMPERPYRIHLLPCLSVGQARLLESMFHAHLQSYRARGEWFTHPNAGHLHKMMHSKMSEIFGLFRTFGYRAKLEKIELDGDRPVFHANGIVSHVTKPDAENDKVG